MKQKTKEARERSCSCSYAISHEGTSAIYGLGFLGAAIYYISTATSFWIGVLGFLKALVWPVFLVKKLLFFVGA